VLVSFDLLFATFVRFFAFHFVTSLAEVTWGELTNTSD